MKKNLRFRKLLLLVLLLLEQVPGFAQANREWMKRHNVISPFSYDNATALAVDASGNVLAAGTIQNNITNGDYAVLKRNKDGKQLWTRKYNGPANSDDQVLAMTTDRNGNIYITGASQGRGTSYDYATVKYDKNGDQKWVARYFSPGQTYDVASAIAVDAAGNVYVTGFTASRSGYYDYATIKYNQSGVQQWIAVYDGPGADYDEATALAVDAAGNVYVTGYSYGTDTYSDYATIKYDRNGVQQWAARYNGPESYYDAAWDLAVDATGNVWITGRSYGPGTSGDFATIKYNADGNEQWVARYNGPDSSYDEANALALDRTGNVYVTGSTLNADYVSEYATIKYDGEGKELWNVKYNSSDVGYYYNLPTALLTDPSGNVYVTGWSGKDEDLYNGDFATVKYNAAGVQQWAERFDGTGNGWDGANAMALDESGNVYVAGESVGKETGSDCMLIKYGAGGSRKWSRRESGTANGTEVALSVAADARGNVAVTGWGSITDDEEGQPVYDYLTIMYNASGSRKWEKRYKGAGNGDDRAAAVVQDASGNVYVTGGSWGAGTLTDYATIKYSASGSQQWIATYNSPDSGFDEARAVAVDRDGNVYVTGYSYDHETYYDYTTIKYDKNGVQQWTARYNGPADDIDLATALKVDDAGNVYVTGYSNGNGSYSDYATIKYDKNGVQQWAARYNGPDNTYDAAAGIVTDAAGNVFITGRSYGMGTNGDYATIKYDAGGNEKWVARYNGIGNYFDAASALAMDASGNIVVTGQSWGRGTYDDFVTLKYTNNGQLLWESRYNGSSNYEDGAGAIAVDGAGAVYVTGYSGNGTDDDYATVKYAPDGTMLWVDTVNGTGNDWDDAYAIAADPRGNVYVTGQSIGLGTGDDFLTVKYAPANAATTLAEERAGPQEPSVTAPGGLKVAHHPNPVSAAARLQYTLPEDGRLSIKLYDMLGRQVATLADAAVKSGSYTLGLDASRLRKGLYYYRLTLKTASGVLEQTNKMTVAE